MKKKKKKVKLSPIISIVFILSSIYLIIAILGYSNVETLLRFLVIGVLLIIDIVIFIMMIKSRGKKHKKMKIATNIVKVLCIILFLFVGFNLNKVMDYINKLNKKVVYSAAMVTLKSNNDTDLDSLSKKKLGIIDDTTQEDGYKLAKEIINNHDLLKKNELVTYPDYDSLVTALSKKEVDYIFLPASYEDIYASKDEFEGMIKKFKTVTTTAKETTKEEAKLLGTGKEVTEPFTVLLMGIDSTANGLSHSDSFNGDTLILVTFNPKTMTATMLSIHRDSYVPITCYSDQHENKINAAAAKGTSCAINTVEKYLGVTVDYYVKINFKGLVKLVNKLGGIEVDVPYALCEQNSKRQFGKHMIYIEKGKQTLNGEQALAFARNRKSYANRCAEKYTKVYRSVELRGQNQQTVILAVLEKAKQFKDISKAYEILDVISDNVDTNMSRETMLSFYNIAKDMMLKSNSDDVIQVQRLDIAGDGQMIYDESSRLVLWYYVPQRQSLQLVKDAMQENLGAKSRSMIKTFSFDVDNGYKETVLGKGTFSEGYYKYAILPNFTTYSLATAQKWAKENGLTLNINYVKSSTKKDGTIIKQEYPVSKRVDRIPNKKMTIDVVMNNEKPVNVEQTSSSNAGSAAPQVEKVDCIKNYSNIACSVPNLIGKTSTSVNTWANRFSNVLKVEYVEEESTKAPGTILRQSVSEGTYVRTLLNDDTALVLTIAKAKEE